MLAASGEALAVDMERAEGYRGIWYMNQPSGDEFKYKYSGGLGTYTAKHRPIAWHSPQANKTFFVYGGSKGVNEDEPLQIMVSYYDHETGLVPRPVILIDKGTEDAHHNPTISLDDAGHIWVFVSSHGNWGTTGYIFKSINPYSIDAFEPAQEMRFTYPQPWHFAGKGFLFLHTVYGSKENGLTGRNLFMTTSPDGETWSELRHLAGFGGHYQISETFENRRVTAFNWHPPEGGLNARTNLYYMESPDFGETWTTIDGEPLDTPLLSKDNPALVRDYQAEGRLVYLKDLTFDAQGRPAILCVLGRSYRSGPDSGMREFVVARWLGGDWAYSTIAQTDHNYDMGSLWIDGDDWTVIAPTEPGPQPWGTGGGIAVWKSADAGETWTQDGRLTEDSQFNHTYVRRPVNAHPGFYAFWADGDAFGPSISRLYFTTKETKDIFMLPYDMDSDYARPVKIE